jgi:hypothetical protein
MRRAQMPAAAPIGVLLSEEAFGHMHFLPKSNGGFAIFLGGFWWREEHKDVHMLQATACMHDPFLFVKRHAVIQTKFAARRSELAYRCGHARQLVADEIQHLQRRELPDLRRQARQLIEAEVQLP